MRDAACDWDSRLMAGFIREDVKFGVIEVLLKHMASCFQSSLQARRVGQDQMPLSGKIIYREKSGLTLLLHASTGFGQNVVSFRRLRMSSFSGWLTGRNRRLG